MTKRISLAICFLLLGSLACFMQSAPSTSPPEPAQPARAHALTASTTESAEDCTVNADALNVRTCASVDCAIVGWLTLGQTVKAEPGSAWRFITRGELSGFTRAKYLTCNSGE